MDWWNQDQNSNDWWNRQPEDIPQPQSLGFFGDLLHSAEHGVSNVGHFFGGIVKGAVEAIPQAGKDLVEAGKTLRDLVLSPVKESNANQVINQVNQLNQDWSKKTANWTEADYNDPAKQAEAQAHFAQLKALNQQAQDLVSSDTISQRDAKKSGLAAFNTVLNLGTLGEAGAAEKALQGAAKIGIPGAKAAATNIATKTAEKAATEAIANRTATGAIQTIADRTAGGALLGAGYGASSAAQSNPDASASDIWKSALLGGALGGGLGGGATLLDKNVRAGVQEVPGALRDTNVALGQAGSVKNPFASAPEPRPADALQTQLETAWNSNDLPTAQKIIDQLPSDLKAPMQSMQDYKLQHAPDTGPLATASANVESSKQQLAGGDIHPSITDQNIQGTAAEYNSPQQYIDDLARSALDREKSQGISLVPTAEGGKSRVSSHAPWYSSLYSDTGHTPTLRDTKTVVEKALQTGRDPGGLIQPGEPDIFQALKDREGSLQQSIREGPPKELSAQYMDSLAGKSQALEAPKTPQPTTEIPTPTSSAAEKLPPNQRGFFGNIQKSETATPELKQAVKEINPQTYSDITSNQELVNKAVQQVNDNPQIIHDKITSGGNLNDQDVVSGLQLMSQYQKAGKIDEAVRLADSLDTNLREHGRAVQAASVWNRLSPEGILRMASNRFAKARENISAGRGFEKGVGGEQKTAQTIQDTVESAGKLSSKNIRGAVRNAAKTVKEPPTTAEKIATNVEKMTEPAKKQKADELVKEITKKVKQEMLPEAGKKPARSPIDVMRDVFARNKEAQDAFPEAQRILMEKAKDNPRMQEVLQKFFDSELGNPVAGSTVNAAIKEQLIKNETKISGIIEKSWNGQRQSIEQVAADLTKEGFDAQSAQAIAKEVTDRLKAQTVIAKQKAIDRLAKDVPKRQQKTFLDKVNKLSNLGALDNHDYTELARAKLKLPQLTSDTAQKISELSQKMQDMQPGYERDKIAHEIYRTINESIPKTLGQKATEALSAPKSIMASYDLSGTLRQGGVLGARFRAEAKTAFKKQVSYFKSSEAYDKGMSAIRHDPMYETAARAKIALTGVEGGEEAFVSQLPERIPIFGKGVQASDRAYTGALTELRFGAFKHIARDLADQGIDINKFSDEQLQSIGKFINTASGRGYGAQGGLFEKVAPALNRTLFSPRLWKSRLDMLNPVYYAKLDPVARKYALQSAGSFAAIASTVLGLATLAGGKVETDPRSSDFLKIRFGNTRYDILGGFQQNLVFAAREISGAKKNSSTGEVKSLTEGGFGSANRLSILSDLISNKENPVISAGADILRGTDKQGNPTSLTGTLGSLFVPLNIQDTYTIAKESNPLQALVTGTLPGTLGVSVNTYPAPEDSLYKQYTAALAGK